MSNVDTSTSWILFYDVKGKIHKVIQVNNVCFLKKY